jgi:hypothetical protein
MPEILDDKIVIAETIDSKTERGGRIEPEQVAAERRQTVPAPVPTIGGKPVTTPDGAPVKMKHNLQVVTQTDVGTLATGFRYSCQHCKHFDRPGGQQILRAMNQSPHMENRFALNQIRAALLDTKNAMLQEVHTNPMDGDMDVEHALSFLGACRAMTEIFSAEAGEFDPVLVYPTGGCPVNYKEDGTVDEDNPVRTNGGEAISNLFEPRDSATKKIAAAGYDAMLRQAVEGIKDK